MPLFSIEQEQALATTYVAPDLSSLDALAQPVVDIPQVELDAPALAQAAEGDTPQANVTDAHQYLLSARGMFQRVRIWEPDDFTEENGAKSQERFYDIAELDAFFEDKFQSQLTYRLYLMQGLERMRTSLVTRKVFLGGEKRVYRFGKSFIEVALRGEVFLGPVGVMTNGFIRLLEKFFDLHSLANAENPVTLREDFTVFQFYLTDLKVETPDPDLHFVRFTMTGFLEDDTHEFSTDQDRLFNRKTIPDCSKGREEFQTFFVGAQRPNTDTIMRENLRAVGLSNNPADALRQVKAANLDRMGNIGSMAAMVSQRADDEVTGALTEDDPPLGIFGALRSFLSGQPEPGTAASVPTQSGVGADTPASGIVGGLVNFTRQKILGPVTTIAGNYVQDAGERAVERASNSLVRNLNLDSLIDSDNALARQVNTYLGNTIGGGITRFGGNVVRNLLWGDKLLLGNSIGNNNYPTVDQLAIASSRTDGFIGPGLEEDDRWIADYHKRAEALRKRKDGLGEFSEVCLGYGPTSAYTLEVPPAIVRSSMSPEEAAQLASDGFIFDGDLDIDPDQADRVAAGAAEISSSAQRVVAQSTSVVSRLTTAADKFLQPIAGVIQGTVGVITSAVSGVISIGTNLVSGIEDRVNSALSGVVAKGTESLGAFGDLSEASQAVTGLPSTATPPLIQEVGFNPDTAALSAGNVGGNLVASTLASVPTTSEQVSGPKEAQINGIDLGAYTTPQDTAAARTLAFWDLA